MIYKYGIHTVPWYNDINAWIIPLQMLCLRKYDRGHENICRGWMSFIFQPLEMSKRAHHPRHCALPGHQVGVQTGTSLTPAFQHIITAGALRQREAHTFLYNLCIKLITLEGGQACGIFTTIKQILDSMQQDSSDEQFSTHTARGMTWHNNSQSEHIWYLKPKYTLARAVVSKSEKIQRSQNKNNNWWQLQQ